MYLNVSVKKYTIIINKEQRNEFEYLCILYIHEYLKIRYLMKCFN